MADRIRSQIGDRQIYMCQTALTEFQDAASRLAGPVERDLVAGLMGKVRIVPDSPTARASALVETKKVGANDKLIFGTADKLGMQIFTGDEKFLRGALAQNVEFDAIVHPPFNFLGR
nr:DUF1308 domain-containing protein [Actinoplanes lutulentus]